MPQRPSSPRAAGSGAAGSECRLSGRRRRMPPARPPPAPTGPAGPTSVNTRQANGTSTARSASVRDARPRGPDTPATHDGEDGDDPVVDLVPDRRLALELVQAGDGDVLHDSGNGDVDQTTAIRNIRNTVESRSGSIANSRQARPQRNCRLVVGRPARSSRHRRTRGPRRTRSPPRRSPRPETPPGSNRTGTPGPPRDDRWATGSRSCCGDTVHTGRWCRLRGDDRIIRASGGRRWLAGGPRAAPRRASPG
jgi:hypothetical protein